METDRYKELCMKAKKLPSKEDENVVHMLLTQEWREYLLDNKWLHVNEETA
jgi:hypothetical protein